MNFNPPPSSAPDNEWSIEFLRGCAAMMVMYAHYYSLAGMERNLLNFFFTGVNLFFVISGFVFAPYFFHKKIQIKSFFIRRIFRIYPLYLVALCSYAALRYLNGIPIEYFFEHLFFLHTLESKEIAFYFNPAFWSLPPEIEFYLAIPLLCVFFRGGKPVLVLFFAALALHFVLAKNLDSKNLIFQIMMFHLPGLLVEFCLGILTWMVVMAKPSLLWRLLLATLGIVLWLVLAQIFKTGGDAIIYNNKWLNGNMGLFAAVSYAFLMASFVGLIQNPSALLKKFAIFIGNLSFGVYLFHNLMPGALEFSKAWFSSLQYTMVCAGATLVVAWILNRFYENPFRKIGRRWANSVEQSQQVAAH